MFPNRLLIFAALCAGLHAQDPAAQDPAQNWSVHFQATSIGDRHGSFPSPYAGANSLPGYAESRVSLTATVFFALRVSSWMQLVVNPEIAGGKGFGQVTGIAGFPNGEIPRVGSATPTLYAARAYLKMSWGLGTGTHDVERGDNQLGGNEPERRFTLDAGRFGITDFFDNNAYSHDPRRQFMNWALMSNGAWDYPADVRGYSVGVAADLTMRTWSLRSALVLEPTEANGPTYDTRLAKNRGVVAEAEKRYQPASHSGAVRVLGFLNRERAGTFRDAILPGGSTDLAATRRPGTGKYGFGLNVEQEVARDFGVFGRYGWSDGKTEAWAFTQIDRSLSGGLALQGRLWKRTGDTIGLAAVRNYLAGDDRRYLAAGGLGFLIGDGRLNYAPESIGEAYYAWHALRDWTFTLDYQRIANPAYNRDRGPVNVGSLRVHWER